MAKRSVVKVGPRGGKIIGYVNGDRTKPIYEKPGGDPAGGKRGNEDDAQWVHGLSESGNHATLRRSGHDVTVLRDDSDPERFHHVTIKHEDGTVRHSAYVTADTFEDATRQASTILGKIETRKPNDDPRAPKPGTELQSAKGEARVTALEGGGYEVQYANHRAFCSSLSDAAMLCARVDGQTPKALNGYAYFKLKGKDEKPVEKEPEHEPTEAEKHQREIDARVKPAFDRYMEAVKNPAALGDPREPPPEWARKMGDYDQRTWLKTFKGDTYQLRYYPAGYLGFNGKAHWSINRLERDVHPDLADPNDWQTISTAGSVSRVTADLVGSAVNGWKWWGVEYEPGHGAIGVLRHQEVLKQRLGGLTSEDFKEGAALGQLSGLQKKAMKVFNFGDKSYLVYKVAASVVTALQNLAGALDGLHETPEENQDAKDALERFSRDASRYGRFEYARDGLRRVADEVRRAQDYPPFMQAAVVSLEDVVKEFSEIVSDDPALAGLSVVRKSGTHPFGGDLGLQALLGVRQSSQEKTEAYGATPTRAADRLFSGSESIRTVDSVWTLAEQAITGMTDRDNAHKTGEPVSAFQALLAAQEMTALAKLGANGHAYAKHHQNAMKVQNYVRDRLTTIREAAEEYGQPPVMHWKPRAKPKDEAGNQEVTNLLFGNPEHKDDHDELQTMQIHNRVTARTVHQIVKSLHDGSGRAAEFPRIAKCGDGQGTYPEGRACYHENAGGDRPVVELSIHDGVDVIAHEFGHQLDRCNRDLSSTAQEWRNCFAMRHNDGKLELVSLNEQAKRRGVTSHYHADEEGYWTKEPVIDKYILKTYSGDDPMRPGDSHSEVLSMAMQYMVEKAQLSASDHLADHLANPGYFEHFALADLVVEHALRKIEAGKAAANPKGRKRKT